jgi:tRNA(Arg) A34 adenosine deaminase TadA
MSGDERHLLAAIELARGARDKGNHPFGAVLVGGDGTVLLEAENTVVTAGDVTGHAELNALREASARFDPDVLAGCTLYASTEPCAMCSGAVYWSGVRRVVFALSTAQFATMLGGTAGLALACRDVFAGAAEPVEVSGPHLEAEARAVHDGFWD